MSLVKNICIAWALVNLLANIRGRFFFERFFFILFMPDPNKHKMLNVIEEITTPCKKGGLMHVQPAQFILLAYLVNIGPQGQLSPLPGQQSPRDNNLPDNYPKRQIALSPATPGQ